MKGSVDNMKFEQLVELIQTVSSSNLGEFKYEEGDFKISLKKEKGEVRLAEQSESVPARADRKSTRLNSSHGDESRMPSSA